jgi:Fe-S-cluster containining protein
MNADDVYETMAAALRRSNEARTALEQQVAELRAALQQTIELLAVTGVFNDGHRAMIDRVSESVVGPQPKVKLRVLVDKYEVESPADLDCMSLMHLCHGRCCSFRFELSTQDLDEGKIRWEVNDPYRIRQERDGYCTHLERATMGCTAYEHRPAPCRMFDCRDDQRVWIDFEKKIPAPMPDGVIVPKR